MEEVEGVGGGVGGGGGGKIDDEVEGGRIGGL